MIVYKLLVLLLMLIVLPLSIFSNANQTAAKMLACLHEPNLLRLRLSNEIPHWSDYDALDLIDFSVLTVNQLRLITVGM